MNIWIGNSWRGSTRRKLILGESWWGPEESVHQYMRRWCNGAQQDKFFASIFNACSGYQTASATTQQKLAFWDDLSFMNFVYWSVGITNHSKATAAHFRSAAPDLELFLKVLNPDVVWILGTTHAKFSQPVVSRMGIRSIITKHPRAGVTATTLMSDYRSL